jgi:hypothetical protein
MSLHTVIIALIGSYAAAAPKPSIILIISDDQGYTDNGFLDEFTTLARKTAPLQTGGPKP